MAIESVEELRDQRTGQIDKDLTRNYRRVFQVITEDVGIGALAVMTAGGIPVLYSPYVTDTEVDGQALVSSIDPQQTHERRWEVTVNYTTKWEVDPTQNVENPLQRPPTYRIGTKFVQESLRKDVDNDVIQNSAGDFFDPLPVIDRPVPTISIQKNLPTISYTVIRDYTNTVNSTAFAGFEAGELRLVQITAEGPQFENGIVFYRWTIDIEVERNYQARVDNQPNVDVKGWELLLVDAGYNKQVSNELKAEQQGDGLDFTTPQLLNGSGAFVARPYTLEKVSYRKFQIYREVDFNDLGIL